MRCDAMGWMRCVCTVYSSERDLCELLTLLPSRLSDLYRCQSVILSIDTKHIHTHIYVHTYTYTYTYIKTHAYTYIYVHMRIHVGVKVAGRQAGKLLVLSPLSHSHCLTLRVSVQIAIHYCTCVCVCVCVSVCKCERANERRGSNSLFRTSACLPVNAFFRHLLSIAFLLCMCVCVCVMDGSLS